MTQQSGNQFDDDLTVGLDNSESFSTDSIDLFEFGGGGESPIARLKTIILSIDWEINDEILQQLEDELLDLGDIWAADKVKQVYVQGLSKIGKYIYKEKANAHPNAIKLLLTFYHNLEKIVSADDGMSEDEKKLILMEDVRKFDQLKAQIVQHAEDSSAPPAETEDGAALPEGGEDLDTEALSQLKVLKAQVLGIDWEINEEELQILGDEVQRLQGTFGENKGQMILLQGIGSLGAYINKKRSQANGKAFNLLHSFYDALEKVTGSTLSAADEKRLLLAEVEKFNDFKAEIAQEKSVVAPVVRDEQPAAAAADEEVPEADAVAYDEFAPTDGDETVVSDVESRLDAVFGVGDEDDSALASTEESDALDGVDVETEADDESGEEALPYEDGGVAPALSDAIEESSFSVEKVGEDLFGTSTGPVVKEEELREEAKVELEEEPGEDIEEGLEGDIEGALADTLASSFGPDEDGEAIADVSSDADVALQGVDVETEADDDSDEEGLPFEGGELAPALAGSDDEIGFGEDVTDREEEGEAVPDDLDDRLGAFFDDEIEEGTAAVEDVTAFMEEEVTDNLAFLDEEEGDVAVEVEPEEIQAVDEDTEEALSFLDDEAESEAPAPAEAEDLSAVEEDTEEALSFLSEEAEEQVEPAAEEVFFEEEEVGTSALEDETILAQIDDGEAVEGESPDVEGVEESVTEEPSFLAEEVEDVSPEETEGAALEDDIAFTVPGEDASLSADEESEEVVPEEEGRIEFDVPGEEGLLGAAAAAVVSTAVRSEGKDVTFEAVADDTEVDPLPGEEFVELTEESEEIAPGLQEEEKFTTLGAALFQLQGQVGEDEIPDLLAEINGLRASGKLNHTDKMFLQLMSSLLRYRERRMAAGDEALDLTLLQDVYSGLVMRDASAEPVRQQQLLLCTTEFLLLLEKEMSPAG